eukprot:GHVU01136944.1.p2 GENE.GHVU01136944.1~~GHVU01136944.1.p2  ORF type:complete len:109 (-),score=18.53 GHVU01136944.1:178-504(-)
MDGETTRNSGGYRHLPGPALWDDGNADDAEYVDAAPATRGGDGHAAAAERVCLFFPEFLLKKPCTDESGAALLGFRVALNCYAVAAVVTAEQVCVPVELGGLDWIGRG